MPERERERERESESTSSSEELMRLLLARLDNAGSISRPDPDPTILTTQQLQREVAALKELVVARLEAVSSRFDGMDKAVVVLQDYANKSPSINEVFVKHEEMFKSISLQVHAVDEHSAARKEAMIAALDSVRVGMAEQIKTGFLQHEERFKSIAQQFIERDTRTEQTSRDSKVAVDAALQAAKEAVNAQQVSNAASITKSETSTTKQIDQLGLLVQASTTALDSKIVDLKDGQDSKVSDLKERMTAIESRTAGITQGTTDVKKGVFDGVGMVVGILGLIALITSAVIAATALHH